MMQRRLLLLQQGQQGLEVMSGVLGVAGEAGIKAQEEQPQGWAPV